MTTRLRVFDLETSDTDDTALPCEVGAADVVDDDGEWAIEPVRSTLVNPGCFINPRASAIHHITDADVKDAPEWTTAMRTHLLNPWPATSPPTFVAHYAKHERGLFDPDGARWICTWKVALRLYPTAPAWSLQCLRYWLQLAIDRDRASPAHRAGPDAYVCAHLLRRMLLKGDMSADDMIAASAQPALLPRITFGKHRGRGWDEVPLDYLDWVVGQSEMDIDTKFTASEWATKRRLRR